MPTTFAPVDLDRRPMEPISWDIAARSVEQATRAMAVLVGQHRTVALDTEGALRFTAGLDVGLAIARACERHTRCTQMATPRGMWAVRTAAGVVLAWDDGNGARLHPVPFLPVGKGSVARGALEDALVASPPRPVSLTTGDLRLPLWALSDKGMEASLPGHVADLLTHTVYGMVLRNPRLADAQAKPWLGNHTRQFLLRAVHPLDRPSERSVAAFTDNTVWVDAQGRRAQAAFAAVLGALWDAGRIGPHDLARAPHAPSHCRPFYLRVPEPATAHQRFGWTSAWIEGCALAGIAPDLA